MKVSTLPGGTIHSKVPAFFAKAIMVSPASLTTWLDITPLARNEWICLVDSGKSEETTARRLKRAMDQLSRGQRRPCCWTGCPHREKNGK